MKNNKQLLTWVSLVTALFLVGCNSNNSSSSTIIATVCVTQFRITHSMHWQLSFTLHEFA